MRSAEAATSTVYNRTPRIGMPAAELAFAATATLLMGVKLQLPLNTPFSLLVSVAFLPVAIIYIGRFRGVFALSVWVVLAIAAGAFITWSVSSPTSTTLLVAQSLRLLNLPMVLAVMLWSRSVLGVRRLVLLFSFGLALSVLLNGVNAANPWKFAFALPATLIILSIRPVFGHRIPQFIAAMTLATVSVVFDARSSAGFLLVAAALTLIQGGGAQDRHRRSTSSFRRSVRYIQLILIVVGAYFLLQGAILEGMLGEEIRTRSEAQVDISGSLIAGGRPELGATTSLIAANPWGYGSGSLPTPSQILIGKSGMASLGYDPNNGYVENYMFGGSFEVHSVLGDMWLAFGPAGAFVAVLIGIIVVRGTGHSLAVGAASTVAVYAATRSIWDLGFSPFFTSVTLLPLAIAVSAQLRTGSKRRDDIAMGPVPAARRRWHKGSVRR